MIHKLFSLKYSFIPLFAAGIIITAGLVLVQHDAPESPKSIAAKAEMKLHEQEARVLKRLNQLLLLSIDESIKENIFNEHEDNLISCFAYLKDSLFAWSDNDVLISPEEADSVPSGSLLKLRNGWYEVFKSSKGDIHFYALLLIKNEFAYQNKYLLNNFNPELRIPDNFNIYIFPAVSSVPVMNNAGRALFYIMPDETAIADHHLSLSGWLYMLAILLFLSATYSFGRWLMQKSILLTIIFSLLVVALRFLMIHFQAPQELYKAELFSPRLYASYAYMNSLGDFLINVLLVLCLLLIFYNSGKSQIEKFSLRKKIFIYSVLLVIVIRATMFLNELLQGIVLNSAINFNTSNVFDLNRYSIIGLLIVALLMFIYFMLVKALVDIHKKSNWNSWVIKLIVAFFLIALVIAIALSDLILVFNITLLASLYISIYYSRNASGIAAKANGFSFAAIITFLFITALYSSTSVYSYNKKKEQEQRELLAGKVETEQDRVAEHLFEDLPNEIATDTTLQNYFTKPLSTSYLVSQRLHRHYFNGYWTKFEIGSYCFDEYNHPFNKNLDSTSYEQFQTVINTVGKPTYADDLFFLTDPKGKSMYLSRISLSQPDSMAKKIGTIFIELEPKFIPATQGFPELFISDKVAFNNDLAQYSYAKYKNDELATQYGDFNYYFSPSLFLNDNVSREQVAGSRAMQADSFSQVPTPNSQLNNEYTFVNRDGYNHLLYRESPDTLIVVSKKQDTVYELITSFSYFFAFFSLLLLIVMGIQNLIQGKLVVSLSLKNRIQLSVIAIVIFSVTTIGVGTIYYIINKYDDNQSTKISDQLKSLLVTIGNDLDEQIKPDSTFTDDIIFRLSKISNSSAIDFNWYDEGGNLMFSSQPKLFDQGIISTLMNPIAYNELTDKQQTQFVHPEHIGKLNYIAAYQTLRDKQDQLLGYIGLPFFEKQNELNKEISTFLSALINIYVLLLSITVLLTFFIASRITKPLLLIQEKLAGINLGKRNEFIQWNEKDEIGELVKEYNKKVEELALSADMLARSERESAWQEMAKQVAHEIKNPLTPMKLGVQHLLNAYKNNSPDKEELVKKISQTLIQQIDSLSNIANEFSNFAKMPQEKNEQLDIISILSDVINLFIESPDIIINFNGSRELLVGSRASNVFFSQLPTPNSQLNVFADKDQLTRVFSNLLKNAIQSIPAGQKGQIDVSIGLNEGFFTIAVKDNGVGIADNQAEKIFTPNFTTKSGGMGLGLAIVKNIVENLGGKVWFKTQIGMGTTFFVTLPALSR